MKTLLERIEDRSAQVVVVGAGYVGLPLAVEIAQAGFATTAYDRMAAKVNAIKSGESHIADVPSSVLGPLVASGKLTASDNPDVLGQADAVIICVPTPLNKTKDPDNSFILDAADMLLPRMRRPQLVVLESTTFPGFTREVLLPKLSSTGLKVNQDFFIAFSPERVDPGNPKFHTRNTPKVIGSTSARPDWRRQSRSTAPSSNGSSRCRHPTRRRWSSCWRTPSARSTSGWSTKSP